MLERTLRRFTPAQVFISSTILDLEEYREEAIKAVLRSGMYPLAMEHDSADMANPLTYSLRLANQADIYVGIIAHRYGELVSGPDASLASITELEYRRAVSREIPILIFIIDDHHPFPPARIEMDASKLERLKQFKAKLRDKHVVKVFTSPTDLGYRIYEGVNSFRQQAIFSALQYQTDASSLMLPDAVRTSTRLTTKERMLFVGLLSGSDTMHSHQLLQEVVKRLPVAIQEELHSFCTSNFFQAHQLIEVCERFPGGLAQLIEAIRRLSFAGPDYPGGVDKERIQQAADLVRRTSNGDPISSRYKRLLSLASIIAGARVTDIALRNIYDACTPSDPTNVGLWALPVSCGRAELIYTILERLMDAPSPNGKIPPILAFATRLTRILTPDLALSLNQWISETATVWGEDVILLDTFRDSIGHEDAKEYSDRVDLESEETASLLIKLQPSDGNESKYLYISAWLQYAGKSTCVLMSMEAHRLSSIARLLTDVLNDVARDSSIPTHAKTRLRLEFFVPQNLLLHDFDALLIDRTARLGVMYLVIVRSLERLADYMYRPFWEEKWNYFTDLMETATRDPVFWIRNEEECDGQRVYAHLIQHHVVTVGLICPPSSLQGNSWEHILHAAVQAGVPVILWPRQLPEAERKAKSCTRVLASLLARENLSQLPYAVMTQRRDAAKKNGDFHIGNHLSLIWEDPTRVPPDNVSLLQPPARR